MMTTTASVQPASNTVTAPSTDHEAHFIPIKFRNDEVEQSDMAEADQGRLPEDEEHDNVLIQPREVGLDRVPTRLSSSDLEGRRQEEEENIQNLVDEVLNTSSEVDFVLGNSDQLHSPK